MRTRIKESGYEEGTGSSDSGIGSDSDNGTGSGYIVPDVLLHGCLGERDLQHYMLLGGGT